MLPGVLVSPGDKKRLKQSIAISALVWMFFVGALAFIPIRPYRLPESSMNPVYIDLTPTQTSTTVPAVATSGPPTQTSPAVSNAATPGAPKQAVPAEPAPRPLQPSVSQTETVSSGSAAIAETPQLSSNVSSPYQGWGGEDPFAPLSEMDLAAENPEAPAFPPGPAQAPNIPSNTVSGTATSPVQGQWPAQTDSLAQRVINTTESLSELAGSEANPNQAQGTASSSSRTDRAAFGVSSETSDTPRTASAGPGSGSILSSMDFGEGPRRSLVSKPVADIPARLLEGQPPQLETIVRFRIDKGGTVIALSIQFDPPLPMDIAEYLKTYVFSRWVFSSSNSDGQVRFKYSIKVR